MKNAIIIISFLLLLIPIAAAETEIFSGSVITGRDVNVQGSNFQFIYDEPSNQAYVQNPVQNLIIKNGECKSNNVFRICITNASYYDRNVTTYVTYYKVETAIYKLTGSLSASHSITNDKLLFGESANITITITNPTELEVSNIKYNETISNFTLFNVQGCSLNENTMSWSGNLQSKYDKKCTAAIIGEKDGTYKLAGSLSYFNGFDTEKKATDTLTFSVLPKQLQANKQIDKHIEMNQPFYINTSLQNINHDEKIDAIVTITLPSNVALLNKVAGFSKNLNVLDATFRLDPGDYFNYSLHLKADSSSNEPVKENFDYIIKGIHDNIENDTLPKIIEPKPIIDLKSESYNLTPGQKFIIYAALKNPSMIYELTNIKATLNAPFNSEVQQNLDKLLPNESYSIISNTLVAPKSFDELNGKFSVNLIVEYKFEDNTKTTKKSLELSFKLLNFTSNSTSNATIPIQNLIQTPNITKTNATVSNVSWPSDKTEEIHVKNPKKPLPYKEIVLLSVVILAALLIITIVINRARKKKNEYKIVKENKTEKELESEIEQIK